MSIDVGGVSVIVLLVSAAAISSCLLFMPFCVEAVGFVPVKPGVDDVTGGAAETASFVLPLGCAVASVGLGASIVALMLCHRVGIKSESLKK